MSKAISRRDFLKVTGAVGAAGLLAACGGSSNSTAASSTASSAAAAESVAGLSTDPVTLTMSWWGGESRHNAYQDAIKAFSAEHSNITVNPTFAAWSGWEDTMSTKFAGGVAEDVCQINWNWLYNYS
ncbi:MAG: extracellular solute-binding protein, partial [Faecalibacterium prausnitzii]